jgi:glycosyltransferase involved in cell wall biosynthesis
MGMKLLYVIGSMEVGGAERHLLRITSDLVKIGHDVQVFAFQPEGPLAPIFAERGIPVRGFYAPSWLCRLIPHHRTRVRLCLLLSMPCLLRVLWERRPDLIHFFLPAAYIIGGLISLIGPSCIRIMSRRSLNYYQLKRPLFAKLERWLHPKMDMVTGNSRAVVDQLEAEGVSKDSLRLIYNGIDISFFNKARDRHMVREQFGISDTCLVMTMVANLISYKGHSDLIQACAYMKNRMPSDWVILLVGRNDGIQGDLEGQARRLNVTEHLRFLGSRRDIPSLLSASDIGILCSHEEGFSNAVLEAMAAALPMVVTDVGGNAEAVVHGETGFVVPARQPAMLAEAILSVVHDENRHLMGLKGQARVGKEFSLSVCRAGYESMYADAMAKKLAQ